MATGGVSEVSLHEWEEQYEEVTALEAIFGETVSVISNPDKNGDLSLYTLKVDVPIDLPRGQIRVDVWAPNEYDVDSYQQVASGLSSPTKPNFNRSNSGKRWHTSFDLNYITPLCLIVTLPRTYPSESCPEFSISCEWLDFSQLSLLCKQLDELWVDNYGTPVIYTWINWLQSNALTYLGLDKSVILTPPMEEDYNCDSRALPECNDLRESLLHLLQHDHEEEKKAFSQSYHSCGICFDEKLGKDFHRIDACTHHFCGNCMKSYCDTHVQEGTVQLLKCPNPDCDEQIPPYLLKYVLGAEAFERWERLMLQKGLEKMGDIVYCPRCQMPVIKEESSELGCCMMCMFSFCTICKDNWHAGAKKCQGVMEKLAKIKDSSKTNASKHKNEDYVRRTRLLKLEYLNIAMVQEISHPCPNCKSDIDKDGGCNKVTCIKCGSSMCWICKRLIKGYDHFNDSNCGLTGEVYPKRIKYKEHKRAIKIRQRLVQDPEARKPLARCPRCHQQCLKENRNNHIKCWRCKTNFCFQCKKSIIGPIMQHFNVAMPCDQHGD